MPSKEVLQGVGKETTEYATLAVQVPQLLQVLEEQLFHALIEHRP